MKKHQKNFQISSQPFFQTRKFYKSSFNAILEWVEKKKKKSRAFSRLQLSTSSSFTLMNADDVREEGRQRRNFECRRKRREHSQSMQLKRYFMQMFDDEKNCISHYSIMCSLRRCLPLSTFCMTEVQMSLRVETRHHNIKKVCFKNSVSEQRDEKVWN